MNLKERIEEIVERVSYYQMGKQEQWTGEYTHFMSPAQATTDILKAIIESGYVHSGGICIDNEQLGITAIRYMQKESR